MRNRAWSTIDFPPGTPEHRYLHDTIFHAVVDSLENMLIHAQLTPSEIREAAMLAAIHHEERSRKREYIFKVDEDDDDKERARERAEENAIAQEIDERRADGERM